MFTAIKLNEIPIPYVVIVTFKHPKANLLTAPVLVLSQPACKQATAGGCTQLHKSDVMKHWHRAGSWEQ